MLLSEIEVLKDFIAKLDFHLNKGDAIKANKEVNDLCIYILKHEGVIDSDKFLPIDNIVDILDGYKMKQKPLVRIGRNEDEIIRIPPHTRYDFYKKQYVSKQPTNKRYR